MATKQKQCSLDFFFSPKKDTKQALPSEIPQIAHPKKDVFTNSNLLSRGSSPPPISSSKSIEFSISPTDIKSENKDDIEEIKEEIQPKDSNQDFIEEPILTPEWKVTQTISKNDEKEIVINNEEEKNIHWELEIIEHRIQFGKDLDHPHPAMAPNVLKNEGLHDVRPREKTRLKHYEQINCVEYIPEFWAPRVWDDNYPKLNHVQSEFLLQEIIEAPFKERKVEDSSEYDNQFNEYSSSSSPITSASNSSSDNEDEKCEITNNARSRSRVGFGIRKKNKPEKRVIKKPALLRISSLLFDTDDEFDTDLEDF